MKLFFAALFLCLGTLALRAQDYSVTPIDGPTPKADSLRAKPSITPGFFNPMLPPRPIFAPMDTPTFETKEQRAARLNSWARNQIHKNYMQNLYNLRLQVFQPFLSLAPAGFVRLQASNPMILGREPGKYPFDNPYSPENFPQTIRSEYDFATGKYKMVPIDWAEYQKNHNYRFNAANPNNAPVPQVQLTPGDQIMNNR